MESHDQLTYEKPTVERVGLLYDLTLGRGGGQSGGSGGHTGTNGKFPNTTGDYFNPAGQPFSYS